MCPDETLSRSVAGRRRPCGGEASETGGSAAERTARAAASTAGAAGVSLATGPGAAMAPCEALGRSVSRVNVIERFMRPETKRRARLPPAAKHYSGAEGSSQPGCLVRATACVPRAARPDGMAVLAGYQLSENKRK